MSPVLQPGDLVEIKSISPEKLSPGQILVVNRDGALICHRLARIFEDEAGQRWVATRAEKSTAEDPPVAVEQVVGEVTRVLPSRLFHQAVWHLKRWGGNLLRRRPLRLILPRFSAEAEGSLQARFLEGPTEEGKAKGKNQHRESGKNE